MADTPPPPVETDQDDRYTVEHASRIYFLPNLMTAGNLFCGFAACLRCIEASFIARSSDLPSIIPPESIALYRDAVWCIFAAMAFDALDGRLARMGGRESLFGAEFDSLADVVSFGLAPALMVFFLIIRPADGNQTLLSVGGFIGFIYLLCAAIRLARFNVITHPLLHRPEGVKSSNKDFVGLPVPVAAGTVAALVLFILNLIVQDKSLHMLTLGLPLLLLLVAMLMVSTVRYPSGKQIDLRTKTKLTTLVIYVVVAAAVIKFKEYGMISLCLGYIFFGLFRHWRRHGLVKRAPLV